MTFSMRAMLVLLLANCTTQVFASYLQRFRPLAPNDKAESVLRKVDYLVKLYPWLAHLEQPKAALKRDYIEHQLDFVHEILPERFYSDERTVLSYANGLEVSHLKVSPDHPSYQQVRRQYWDNTVPTIVSVRNPNGSVQGEYLYIERGLNHLHNIYPEFRFENLLEEIELPILNVAPGGHHFSWTLVKLNTERQQELPKEDRKLLHVFNMDLSGTYQTFTNNQFYLFGDMYDTGLPANTFGAVLAFGGPLNRRTCPWDECISAIRELARVAAPGGRLLIEFRIQAVDALLALEEAGINYADVNVYDRYIDPNKYEGKKITRLLDIRLE